MTRRYVDTDQWRRQAACRGIDPDLFHPEQGESTAPAKAVCASCPVWRDCLSYALSDPSMHGVAGRTSDRERRRIRLGRVPNPLLAQAS